MLIIANAMSAMTTQFLEKVCVCMCVSVNVCVRERDRLIDWLVVYCVCERERERLIDCLLCLRGRERLSLQS